MAFSERAQIIDRRKVAYGAALAIALGGLAAGCEKGEVDPLDIQTWYMEDTEKVPGHDQQTEMAATTFDLTALNLVDMPRQ